MLRLNRRLAPLMFVALLGTAGCDLTTAPVVFQDFQWLMVENANDVIEGIDAAAFGGDVALLGQLRTPTRCFKLSAHFDHNGSSLAVHIAAEPTNAPTCDSAPGGYQYTAAIRGLDAGDYTLRVTHSVPGSPDKEYTKSISVN